MNIIFIAPPAATTSKYGVTKLSSSTSSTSTSLAATASAVKAAYDLANGKQEKLTSGTNIKTVNGESILGSGDLVIGGGNVEAVDTGDVIDDVTIDYATKTYVDGLIGDINSVLESIISGGGAIMIKFTINSDEYQAEYGMAWEEFVNSEYNIPEHEIVVINGLVYTRTGVNIQKDNVNVLPTDIIINNMVYTTSIGDFPS